MATPRKQLDLAKIDYQKLPPGVSLKQWRLAHLLPRAESAYKACVEAGYTPKSSQRNGRAILASVGVTRAMQAVASSQLDRARGLAGLAQRALEAGGKKIDELRTEDKLAFGLKATELSHTLGQNIAEHGSADAWRYRIRRAIRLAYYLGQRSVTRSRQLLPPPSVIDAEETDTRA